MDDRVAGALALLPGYAAHPVLLSLPALPLGVARRRPLAACATPRTRLRVAEPVIMAGARTAAGWTSGIATLSSAVGQTSLGNFIFSGLQTENWIYVLTGCIAVVILALFVDQMLGLVETGAVHRDGRRIAIGLAALLLGTAAAAASLLRGPTTDYVLGAKNFSEQYILTGLMAERIEQSGHTATRKEGLGSAVIFRALAGSEIDAYVDYSGTLWTNVMERRTCRRARPCSRS